MNKKILCTLVLGCFAVSGCGKKDNNPIIDDGPTPTPAPAHHFSSEYSSNETRHWFACTDEGCEEKKDFEFHDFDEWEYLSYATKSGNTVTKGKRRRTCQVCDYVQEEDHEYEEGKVHECEFSEDWEKNENYHWNKCTVKIDGKDCTEKEHYEKHIYGDWIYDSYAKITHDATGLDDVVDEYGMKHRVCDVCGYSQSVQHTEEEPVGAHEHTFESKWLSDENNHWHPCSYEKIVGYGGRDQYRCEEKGSFGPHVWDAGVVTKQPTTSSEGIKTYTCSTCGATKTESITPLVDNTDGSETITVNFNQLQGKQAATVNAKTKAYIDDMKEDEKNNVTDPYKFLGVYKNGIDVADYLNKEEFKDSAGQGHNKPNGLTLSWDKGSMDYETATIKYYTKADMSDALEVATTGTSVKINNLLANTKYYYQLSYTKGTTLYKSNIASFETADYIRFIDMGLVYNVRDMGGYKTSFGGRVKQGLVYRGSELTPKAYSDNNGSHPKNIDAEILQLQKDVLKISVEIDHRSSSEAPNLPPSPLSTDEFPVEYRRDGYKVSAYTSFLTAGNTEIQNIYKAFAEADTKHVYYHCIGGADRTGCVGFVLLGMLGVSYIDAVTDFEVTTATNYPRSRYFNNGSAPYYSRFPEFLEAFAKASWFNSNKSFKDNCVAFLKSKGVTDATIEAIRTAMIEGYTSSTNTNTGNNSGNTNANTNTGTHTENTHVWGTETKVSSSGCRDVYTSTCSCGKKKISFVAKDGTLASGSTNNNSAGYMKLASNGNSISYKINLPEAVNGKVYFYGCMDSWPDNGSKSYFSGKDSTIGATHADTNGNFTLKIDDDFVDFSHMKSKTYADMFTGSGSNSDEAYAEIGAVSLSAGEHNIVFTRVDSYNVLVKNFVFIY